MRVKTQRLLPGKDCRQQTLSHIDGIFLHESFQPKVKVEMQFSTCIAPNILRPQG